MKVKNLYIIEPWPSTEFYADPRITVNKLSNNFKSVGFCNYLTWNNYTFFTFAR